MIVQELKRRGWSRVFAAKNVVYKNGVYVVIYRDGAEQSIPADTAMKDRIVCMRDLTHNEKSAWYAYYDGFLISEGKIGRYAANVFDFGMSGADSKKFEELINTLDALGSLSVTELTQMKKKEEYVYLNGETVTTPLLSNKGIATTRRFIADTKSSDVIAKYFKSGAVYNIGDFADGKFGIYDDATGDLVIRIELNTLTKMEENKYIIAVEYEHNNVTDREIIYQPVFLGKSSKDVSVFNDFELNSAQRSVLASTMHGMFNVSALLDNRRSVAEMDCIKEIISEKADTSCLVDKLLDVEHLELLKALARNGLPIDGFCSDENIETLKQKYSGMMESSEMLLAKYKEDVNYSAEAVDALRYVIFYLNGIKHVASGITTASEIYLKDLITRKSKYSYAGNLLLEKGVASDKEILVNWGNLSPEEQRYILNMYRVDGVEPKAGCTLNQEVQEKIGKISEFGYSKGRGFELRFTGNSLLLDDNSVALADVLLNWRVVLVNEKFYSYGIGDYAGIV